MLNMSSFLIGTVDTVTRVSELSSLVIRAIVGAFFLMAVF
jgi:hypothetical protein